MQKSCLSRGDVSVEGQTACKATEDAHCRCFQWFEFLRRQLSHFASKYERTILSLAISPQLQQVVYHCLISTLLFL